ncbi:MAG TPA: DinB family protein [Longimicrobiales bacterium]|nr:DinB family protein [Longimicrobiales bacterium]
MNSPTIDALTVRPPRTREEILLELARLAAEVERVAGRFDTATFFAPQMEDGTLRWSPAEQVRHLTKSTYPLARAYGLPRFLLLLRFGLSLRPSAGYVELDARYTRLLESRPDSGRYAPRPEQRRDDERRAEIMAHWRDAISRLSQAAGTWSERALDRFRLPHPLLGHLTTREMLFFTVFHTSHHGRQMARRAAAQDAAPLSPPRPASP